MKKAAISVGATGALALTMLAPVAAAQSVDTGTTVSQQDSQSSRLCPLVAAHRGGGSPDVGENSMRAFRKSARLGVYAIETDIHYTKDRVAIIMHDESLDRTTNGTGDVRDKTYAQIKKLRLNNGQRIPSFSQVLNFAKRKNLRIISEYKDVEKKSYYRRFYKEIKASGAKSFVAGFSNDLLDWTHQKDPKMPLMWFHLGNGVTPDMAPDGANAGFLNIFITPALVSNFVSDGHKIGAWYNTLTGKDDPSGWGPVTAAGVRWITTDNPREYQEWQASNSHCTGRPPKKQKAYCAKFPSHLKNNSLTVLLKRKCLTTASQNVVTRVKAKKSVAKLVKGKNGKRSVKTMNRRGKVTIIYKAAATDYYQSYKRTKTYRLSDGGRG